MTSMIGEKLRGLIEGDICDAVSGIQVMHRKNLAHNDAQGKNFVVGPNGGKSAWADYDQTQEVQPSVTEQQRDAARLMDTAVDMAGNRASVELLQFRKSNPKDAQKVYDTICSDERIPLVKYNKALSVIQEFTPEPGLETFD